jgi:ornithine--oxo-acid transaminase
MTDSDSGSGTDSAAAATLDVAEILSTRAGEEFQLADRYLNHQFVRVLRTLGFDREWANASGAYLVDREGQRYLDMLGGFGVFALGRNNEAVRDQLEGMLAARTPNLPQMGVSLLAGVLAEQLLARVPPRLEAALFTNSGAESVEAAIKLARAATGRPRILYCEHGFHGLTLGALSVNGNEEFRERFGPLLPGCDMIPFGDLDALERELARGDVAAFLVEPVQGKTVRIPEATYLPQAQDLCRRSETLLVADEIQTGLGRTGRWFAFDHWSLEPDLVTVSKALSAGYVPVGAVLASRSVFDSVFDSMERAVAHGSTFATNDLAAAAGIATLGEIEQRGLVEHARRMGELLLELTLPLVDRHEMVRDVRGLGLMWAIEFAEPSGPVARRLWQAVERRQPGLFSQLVAIPLFTDHRILTQVAGHRVNVIKAIPPLVIDEQDLRTFAGALDDVLQRTERLPRAMARFGITMARRARRARTGASR